MARADDFGSTGLWARVNALNSPWFLDDMTRLVGEIGDKLDVIMLPKVEGPWDIHFIDQFLAQLEARHAVKKPIMIHAILETAQGVNNVARDRRRLAAPARHEPWTGRPCRIARHEDDARRRRPSGLSRAGRRRRPARCGPPLLSTGSVALYCSPVWSMPAQPTASSRFTARSAISPTRPPASRNFAMPFFKAARARGRYIPAQIAIANRVFSPDLGEVAFAKRSSPPCPTVPAQSWSTARCRTTRHGNRPRSSSISRDRSPQRTRNSRPSTGSEQGLAKPWTAAQWRGGEPRSRRN